MNHKISKLATLALMSTLCYIGFSFFKMDIPIGGGSTAIHLGNTFCVLAALMMGGVEGGLAGAIGMGIGDLFNPLYLPYFPKTFILKLGIGLCTGAVAKKMNLKNIHQPKKLLLATLISSGCGMAFNVIGEPLISYFYNQFILGVEGSAMNLLLAWTAGTTLFNAITTIIIASSLYLALRKALGHSYLAKQLFRM